MTKVSLDGWIREHLPVLTEIQALSWSALEEGGSALLVAPTGTGKTEAAMVPLLREILREKRAPIRLLYITPLRALNRDLEERLLGMSQAAGLITRSRHGDTSQSERSKQSRSPPDILITTPETLQLLLIGKNLRKGLANVQAVVVDEIHELASSDRGAQLALSLERLEEITSRPLRRIGLSATIANPSEISRFLTLKGKVNVICVPANKRFEIRVTPPKSKEEWNSTEKSLRPGTDERFLTSAFRVADEVRAHRSTLVFANTRPAAETLVAYLRRLAPDLRTAVHHGSLSREVREEAEREFKRGDLRALVATSSLELGIDIGVADHVVQFGSPHRVARLLQRVGRSGHRMDETSSGMVVSIDAADLEEAAVIARRALAGHVEEIHVRRRNGLALAQQMVALVRERGEVALADIARVSENALSTMEVTLDEIREMAGLLSGFGSMRLEGEKIRRGRSTLDHFYSNLSLIPDEKSYPLRDIGTRRLIGTLDERFVISRVMTDPEYTFLLHGTTWKMVKLTGDELLVEPVKEMGSPPHWEGDDIPVPYEVAQEIGRFRRERNLEAYPLSDEAVRSLSMRFEGMGKAGPCPTDVTLTAEMHGRQLVIGACFGTKVNSTFSTILASIFTEKLSLRTDVLLVSPVWIVLALPGIVAKETILEVLKSETDGLEEMFLRALVRTEDYKWSFLVVARKLGLLRSGSDTETARHLDPLIESYGRTLIGREAISKALHEKFDLKLTMSLLHDIASGRLHVEVTQGGPQSPGNEALERLRWKEVPGRPPPTLLKAVRERLEKEELVTVCLRCGFIRTLTPGSYRTLGGSPCLSCHGVLTAVVSPRRRKEIEHLSRYISGKKSGRLDVNRQKLDRKETKLISSAHASAALLSTYGVNALLVLAGRGIGPETAGRILTRGYESSDDLIVEILRAERNYARTRDFWE